MLGGARHRRFSLLAMACLLIFPAALSAAQQSVGTQAAPDDPFPAASSDGGLVVCSDSDQGTFAADSDDLVVVRQCSFTAPAYGMVYISADATVGFYQEDSEAFFDINLDSVTNSGSYYRHVAVHDEGPAGHTNTYSMTAIRAGVSKGPHTVYLMTRTYGVDVGLFRVYNSSLSVIFIPTQNTDVMTCRDNPYGPFTTTEATYQLVAECSLDAPAAGWVYVSADAHAGTETGYYAAKAKINIDDSTVPADNPARWIHIAEHPTSGDTDGTLSFAGAWAVAAGTHDFSFFVKRVDGSGTVQLNKPALSVIYAPWTSPLDAQYTALSGGAWTTDESGMQNILSLDINAEKNGWAFISANALVWGSTDNCQGGFRIGLDSAIGDRDFGRYVSNHSIANTVTNKSLAITGIVPVTAGQHTVNLVGERHTGDCTVTVYGPTLTVLLGSISVYLPLVAR